MRVPTDVEILAIVLIPGVAACGPSFSPPDPKTTQEVVAVVAEVIADSAVGPVVVAPLVGEANSLVAELAFDTLWDEGFGQEYPHLPPDLFERGRFAKLYETALEPVDSERFEVVPRTLYDHTQDSVGGRAEQLIEAYGPGVLFVAFAQPAVSASGDEALVYFLVDQLVPKGRTSLYGYLKRVDGSWSVRWILSDYVE